MRTFLILALVLSACASHAQKTIWSHAVGNWRNGPVVYITEVIETTEAETTTYLMTVYKRDFFPKDVTDIDILRFATKEEGEESIRTLQAKYGMRKLEVRILPIPSLEGPVQEEIKVE